MMRYFALAILTLVLFSSSSANGQSVAPLRLAYTFGNSGYGQGMALKNPRIDAVNVSNALNKVGFTATANEEISSRAFRKELVVLRNRIRSMPAGSTVLIYYAGHGFNIGNRSYLAPVDFDFSSLKSGLRDQSLISVSELIDSAAVNAEVKAIIIIDACRNLADLRGISDKIGGFNEPYTPPNVMMIYASQTGTSAADGLEGEGSPLARAIQAQFLENSSDANVFFQKVSEKVLSSNRTQRVAINLAGTSPGNIFSIPENTIFCANCYLTKLRIDKKYDEVFRQTLARAENGDPEAMHWVGTMYAFPDKWSIDKSLSTKLFGKEIDDEMALKWFRKAARAGYQNAIGAWATVALADSSHHKKDIADGISAYEFGASQGDKQSLFQLGCIYSSKYYGIQDYPKAVHFYSQALEFNNCCGALNLAEIYLHGKPGVPENRQEARRLYEIAEARGNAGGSIGLAGLFRDAKDYANARRYFERGMIAGSPAAYYLLGSMLWTNVAKPGPDEAAVRSEALAMMRRARDLAVAQKAYATGFGDKDPSTGKEYYTAEFYQAVIDLLMRQNWIGKPMADASGNTVKG